MADSSFTFQASDYIALTALAGSAFGWYVTYNRTKSNRCSARLDEVESLSFSLTNDMVQHLLLPGNDNGAVGRMVTMQNEAGRLREMINDIFDRNIPTNTRENLNTLWEKATSEPVTDVGRAAMSRHSIEVCETQRLPTNLIRAARGKC